MNPYTLQRSLLLGAMSIYLAMTLAQLQTKHAFASSINHISARAIMATLREQIIEAGRLEQGTYVLAPAF